MNHSREALARAEKIQLAMLRMDINLDGALTATEELIAAELDAFAEEKEQAMYLHGESKVHTAVNEEREACAKMVADAPGNTYTTDCDHEQLAASIRSRSGEAGK